jgi:hypothetical protein
MQRNKEHCSFIYSAAAGLFWLMVLALTGLSGCNPKINDLTFTSEYQAVFLDNGQVFFGKLSDTGSSYLTLRDIYYVQTLTDPAKKQTSNILIKRGSEWHNPEFMRINSKHVVVIEPVGADSQVAQLIRETQKAPAPGSKTPPTAPATKPESPVSAPSPAPKPAQ